MDPEFLEFLALFRSTFPEFNSVTDAIVFFYYEQANAIFGACKFARLYLTAHLIALDQQNNIGQGTVGLIDGGNGETTSERVGEVQVALKTMADSGLETYYTTTPYGRRYLAFKKACPTYVFSPRVYPNGPNY